MSTEPAPEATPATDDHEELTPAQRRENVIRLAFDGDERRYDAFCEMVRSAIPPKTGVVLRGSSVTGRRWKDGAPFDANGAGTSDLDLTLVGADAIKLFKLGGFYLPGVHSRPVSEKDREIAPDLIPLREALMAMVGRPVNIQATRDFVMHFRGDVLGQPYHVLIEKPADEDQSQDKDTIDAPAADTEPAGGERPLKILSYNICRGGAGREDRLAAVVRACDADLVVLQEATFPHSVKRIADACGMSVTASRVGHSLAFMSRRPVLEHAWHKPRLSRHAFLEVVPEGDTCRVFGVHLSAVHAAWTERRRLFELRALLLAIARHQHGLHVLVGDFNTLAPGELLDVGKLPPRLRALVWLSGGTVRWRTVHSILEAGYIDAFRHQHADTPGHSFPTWNPHIRLDFAFVPAGFVDRLRSCEVVTVPEAREASDHFPLLTEIT